jgi:hypothetical protein
MDLTCILRSLLFLERAPWAKLRLYIMMVLIDRAWKDDSIGCHDVLWSNLDLNGENSGCGSILDLPMAF